MQTFLYVSAAILAGVVISAQPPMNAVLARSLGSSAGAATISIAVALICMILVISVTGMGKVSGAALTAVPWWVYLAGLAGAVFVAAGVMIAPVTGALVFFVCIIAGQLIGSALADHFGAFGLELREISLLRVIGILMVLGGAAMAVRW